MEKLSKAQHALSVVLHKMETNEQVAGTFDCMQLMRLFSFKQRLKKAKSEQPLVDKAIAIQAILDDRRDIAKQVQVTKTALQCKTRLLNHCYSSVFAAQKRLQSDVALLSESEPMDLLDELNLC